MERYLIGDEFANMYNVDTKEFFANKGTIYTTKKSAEDMLDILKSSKKYPEWKLKLWTINLAK